MAKRIAKKVVKENAKALKDMDLELGDDLELDLDELEGMEDDDILGDLEDIELDDELELEDEDESDEEELELDDELELEEDEDELELELEDEDESDEEELELDDEDELDDEELDLDELVEEEEEEIIEKPKKTTKKVSKIQEKKTPKKTTTKKAVKEEVVEDEDEEEEVVEPKKTTTKKKVTRNNAVIAKKELSYDEQLEDIKENRVDKYYKALQDYRDGKIKICTINRKLSRQAFSQLYRAKVNEEESALRRAVASMTGLREDEAREAISALPKNHARNVIDEMFDVMYDLLFIESGVEIFNTEDCKLSIEGNWTEEQIKVVKLEHTSHNATMLKSYLKVSSSSQAPENKKVKGNVDAKGNFKEIKKVEKKETKKEEPKKTTKKTVKKVVKKK